MVSPTEHSAGSAASDRPLAGQVAVITGTAIARELATCGVNLIIDYAHSVGPAEELARSLKAENEGIEAVAIQADVADEQQAHNLIAQAAERFGRLDILVNNAGITRDRTLRKMTSEQWREVINTDLSSIFYCTQPAVEHIIAQVAANERYDRERGGS